jgi:hydroxyacylglutathione hydrolase
MGCGRLFEGTPAQMLDSLHRIAQLPGEFYVHCAHEYTLSNLAFAMTVDPDNTALIERGKREHARRARGEATIPALLSEERATNPFLRAHQPGLKASAEIWKQSPLPNELAVFTALREWKNQFKV